MGSFANILLFVPSLFCGMLATLTSACCSLGMSAGHYLITLAYQTAKTVVYPFRVCYGTFIRRYNALVSCCWTCWSCAYSVVSYPFEFIANQPKRPIIFMTKFAHICNAAITWWLRFALTITTTPWSKTCYALCITRQLFNSWAHISIKRSSCAGTILLAVCAQLKKESLQLLWALTPYPCKAVYTWLWPATRHHSSSPQASSTSGRSSKTPSTVVSASDVGTDTVTTDHSSNEGSGFGAGAASSSSPRSTLAGGAVFGGEPMPIGDTQFLAPRLASLMWDERVRGMMLGAGAVPYGSCFRLAQCDLNPAYYQLDPAMYPEEFSLIGQGTQGTVSYAQTQDSSGKWIPVAVKVMPYDDEPTKDVAKREIHCMRAVKGAHHTATLLSARNFEAGGKKMKVIAMKFLENVNIEQYFGGLRKLDTDADINRFLPAVVSFFEGAVKGTAAVHDAGWAHMDLKPDNLCMEIQDGLPHPYLVDFGSSLMQDTNPLVMPQTSLPYACPEVLLFLRHMTDDYFELISFQAQDIWSLGCLLVWLIMGRDPFSWFPSTESDLLMGHMECLCKKHAAWAAGSLTGPDVMAPSSLEAFEQLTLDTQHPMMRHLFDLADWMLQPCTAHRPTAREVLFKLQAMSAS